MKHLLGKTRYPNPKDSIGDLVTIDYTSSYWWDKSLSCWDATGPALAEFEELEPYIKQELDQSCRETTRRIIAAVYMIGKSQSTARPVIVLACTHRPSAEEAKKILKKSRILAEHPWFKVYIMPTLPTGKLRAVTIGGGPMAHVLDALISRDVSFDRQRPIRSLGWAIFIKHSATTARQATANVVHNGFDFFYLTAAHVFFPEASSHEDFVGWEDFKFNLDSESETEDGEFEILSQHSVTSPESENSSQVASSSRSLETSVISRHASADRFLSPEHEISKPQHPLEGIRPVGLESFIELTAFAGLDTMSILGEVTAVSVEQDWALISVTDTKVLDYLRKEYPPTTTYTSHGFITGSLSASGILMQIPNSKSFQSVYQFTHRDPLQMGDCGSFVFDKDRQELYGIVIAGSDNSNVGWMMAAQPVVQEISEIMKWQLVQWPLPKVSTPSSAFSNPIFRNVAEDVEGSPRDATPPLNSYSSRSFYARVQAGYRDHQTLSQSHRETFPSAYAYPPKPTSGSSSTSQERFHRVSPSDFLAHKTSSAISHYPPSIIRYLEQNSDLIDAGYEAGTEARRLHQHTPRHGDTRATSAESRNKRPLSTIDDESIDTGDSSETISLVLRKLSSHPLYMEPGPPKSRDESLASSSNSKGGWFLGVTELRKLYGAGWISPSQVNGER
ncbi:hypothetical protein EJ04DRAFT_576804 [Polyplosphaeria fusca]|uniref:Uncharacterized protein n=1 Tax=Polyplosphaeria fusca TaxID=682080 RepID=A0A9P4R0L0_9PLEO|nr:hypothetical protein EJ04DRAFT_576804 [Polyplosphaeria fusca]